MQLTAILVACAVVLGAQSSAGPAVALHGGTPGVWSQREFLIMGTRLDAGLRAETREQGLSVLEDLYRAVRDVEELLSTWQKGTELGRLNRAPPGEPQRISAELFSILSSAQEWSRRTHGAFEPQVGALVDAWDLRGSGRHPGEQELERARVASGRKALVLDALQGTATRGYEDGWVDPGGFGKGVALLRAREVLRREGIEDAIVDLGGQVLVLGGREDGWVLPVAHPARRSEPAVFLRVSNRSVATSGGSERFVQVEEDTLSHVLDPRSGVPVSPWGSVTVVAEDPVVADVLSTALFVMGPGEALRWAKRREEYGVLILELGPGGMSASWNRALEAHLKDVSVKPSKTHEQTDRPRGDPS